MSCLFCSGTVGLQPVEFYMQDGQYVAKHPILTGNICGVCSGEFSRLIITPVKEAT